MTEPRIIVTFTCKDAQDTTVTEAERRLEQSGWQHVQVEALAADHRGDISRLESLANAITTSLDALGFGLAPALYSEENTDNDDIRALAGKLLETVEVLP
ncbi:hypothetical protein KIH77_08760 [Bifidobacterium sp. 82T24]|uniref:hypothetical protein n=1 Tax=Bifidobacterium pluvialisilvae TaxID=2834436 RepID=UPI001C59F29A|nr:hypothetical protein [Bifidobacterium pluvialisilvae]MBW3088812.1 hypothetical protein [Bifidobacterium pluvialisilvae]